MENENRLTDKFHDFIITEPYPYFLYIHNTEGIFTFVSENIAELLGHSTESFQKHYFSSLTESSINKYVIAHTEQSIQGKQQEPYLVEMYDTQMKPRLLKVYETPIVDETGIIGVEGVAKVLS